MSFGGGGSQGTIRYALIVDDAQATQKLNTFKTNLNSVGASTNTLNKNMGALGNNFKNATGGLTQQNTLLGNTIKQHTTLGNTIKTNASRFAGLATGLSATASGALQLAAGFRDYNDAQIAVDRVTRRLSLGQEALGKAQTKLNDLQKKGVTSGKDYEQAQLDVTQAQQQVEIQTQLVGEAQERLFDSQTQFVASVVPTVLGAVGSLGFAFKEFGGSLGKLTGSFKEGGMAAKLFSSDLGLIGIAATASVAVALLVIDTVEKARQKWKALGVEFTEGSIFDTKKMVLSQQEYDEVIKRTNASVGDMMLHQEDVLKKFKEMGGVLDNTGKVMITVKDRSFDIGAQFKKNGETTATWIGWMRNYLEMSGGTADIMAKLTKAGFDEATAKKIAAAAQEDYNNKVKAGIPIITQSAKEVKKATDAFIEQDKILGKMTEIKLRQYMLGWENAMAEVIVTTKDNTRQAMTTSGAEIAEGMATGISALDLVLKKEAGNATNAAINEMLGIIATRGPEWSKAIEDHWTVWTPEVEQAFNDVMKTANTSANKIADDQKKAADESAKAWQDFQKESRAELFTVFDIKTPEDMKQKFMDKIRKALPDKVEKKIDLILKAQAKEEGFKAGAAAFLGGLAEEIKGDEKLADAVIKGIAKKAPKGALKDWLTSILDAPDSGDIVVENLKQLDTGEWVLKIPSELVAADSPGTPIKEWLSNQGVSSINEWAFGNKPVEVPAEAQMTMCTDCDILKNPPKIPVIPVFSSTHPRPGVAPEGVETSERPEDIVEGEGGELDFSAALTDVQTLQKALDSLASYGAKNLAALGKAAKTHFNSVANYANGATTFLQTNQTALDSLAKHGAKNMQALGKNAKTHFNSVANYANGATGSLQTLQKALDSLQKHGVKNMSALAKAAKTNFNTVANYASGATKQVKALQSAIDNLEDKTVTVTYKQEGTPPRGAQHGMHETLMGDTLIMAHRGERVDIGPGDRSRGGGGGGSSSGGNIVINLTNVLADREITRTFRREMGKDIYRFGPT